MQMQEVIRRHTQVVQALSFVSQIDFHPLSPGHLLEGEVQVHHYSRISHCCFVLCKQDNSSRQVENGRSFVGVVAVVEVLSDAHLQKLDLVLNLDGWFLKKGVNGVSNTNLQIGWVQMKGL